MERNKTTFPFVNILVTIPLYKTEAKHHFFWTFTSYFDVPFRYALAEEKSTSRLHLVKTILSLTSDLA